MKHSERLEIIGILSLSLILTAAFSVSSCLPEMMKTFDGYSLSSMELLMSLPAISMTIVIALSPILSRYINERVLIVAGLLLYGISGVTPVFVSSYSVLFVCRILMGAGTGLINTKAVSLIGERFSGALQQKLQGIRCSMETLGQTALTLLVGFLLPFGWNYAFLVYVVAFPILIMYLLFVPAPSDNNKANLAEPDETADYKLSPAMWRFVLGSALLAMLFISSAMLNTLRITSYITETGIGTAVHGATILSISTFAGFLGGFAFGPLIKALKKYMLPFCMAMIAVGLAVILFVPNLIGITLGASICSFFVADCTSYIFSGLSEQLPSEALVTANSAVLVGCNLGSSLTTFILQAIGMFTPTLSAGFAVYAVAFLVVAIGMCFKNLSTKG